jgi:hypothetical protein
VLGQTSTGEKRSSGIANHDGGEPRAALADIRRSSAPFRDLAGISIDTEPRVL